jgi:site-specific DNA recombinase
MADLYRRKVTELAEALADEESRAGATESLRGLIDSITLTPDASTLRIELQGNLAAMLRAAEAQSSGKPLNNLLLDGARSPSDDDLVQIMVVAGGGFEPPTFGL